MAKHAVLSPSGAARWIACPASVPRTAHLPSTSSKYADEGTAAHFLAAMCLSCSTRPEQYEGLTICLWRRDDETGEDFEENLDHTEVKVTARFYVDMTMIEEVSKYVDYVNEVVSSTGGDLYVEQTLPLEALTGEAAATGTSDAVIVTQDELHIIDLKYGMGEAVGVDENPQLMLYLLAAYERFRYLTTFTSFRTTIHQPRLNSTSERQYTMADLIAWREKVKDAAEVTRQPDPPANPGEKQCRWCKLSGACPEQAAYLQEKMAVDFDDLTQEDITAVQNDMAETINGKMRIIGMVEDWCKAVRSHAEALLLSGVELPDFKLVQGKRGARKWADEALVADIMKRSFRLKVEDMYDLKLISPTTAEKVLKDQPKRWERLQEHVTQSEGGLSVAPVSDKRPAVVVSPVEFDDVRHDHLI